MVSFRQWLPSLAATGSSRSRRKAGRKAKTGRTWISQGIERLESRAMFACMPPSDLSLAPADINENMPAGTTVGQFSTTDADSSGPFKYSFQGGPSNLDNEHFFLTGDVLKTRASFDFESVSSYQVSIRTTDSDGHSFSKEFTITVNDVQEAPMAADDAVLTTANTPVSGNVLQNDSDPEGDTLTAMLATDPANGTVELNADGSFVYTPNADYVGTDSFTYTADDGNGNTASAMVTITIDPLNDAPVAGDDSFATDEDVPVSGNVLVNDTDADGDSLSAALDQGPANGTVELNSDGSFTYTPSADFNGEDSFTYIVDDGSGQTATGTVTISIAAINDAPVAGADEFATDEDMPVSGNVLVNDTDVEGDSLVAALAQGPTSGTVELNSDGSFTYTPSADFNGSDSFTYTVDDGQGGTATGTVSITVNAINDAPVANNDELVTDEDMPANGNVLTNDSDVDGDSLTAALQDGPTSGAVEMNADGSFTYTPNADFNGSDSFTYVVDDGQGGTAIGTVSITVNPVNDAPVAVNDEATTDEDMPVSGNVLTNDSDVDGDSLTAALQDGPANGTAEVNADGSFTYTPNADFNGSDSFTYVVDDGQGGTAVGTVSITVNAINDAPVATDDEAVTDEDMPVSGNVLANDTDADGDSMTAALQDGPANGTVELASDGSFTYTPNADFNGSDSFTYVVDDGQGGTAIGTVSITVNPVNDAPLAVNDEVTTDEDTPASGNVLTNDSDVDGDSLTAALQDGPANGTVELAADGSFTYTPNADFNGSDSFTYVVDDGQGGTAIGTVSITVNPVDDGPSVVDDSFSTDEDVSLTIPIADLLSNDVDPDGELPTFLAAGGAVNGTVKVQGDNVIFTPSADFNGTASFEYAVQDSSGGVAFANVTVSVNPIADAPVANDDSATTEEGTPLTIPASSLLANDTDADGDTLSVIAVGGASGGTVSLVDGNVVFTPEADFTGTGSFHYVISDGTGQHALGRVVVEVTPQVGADNTDPVATADSLTTEEGTQVMTTAADLLANDIDADGDALSLVSVGDAFGGTVELVDNQITFTPDPGVVGTATFSYTISDGRGGTATGIVTIDVTQSDDGTGSIGEDPGSDPGSDPGDDGDNCDPPSQGNNAGGNGNGLGHVIGNGNGHGNSNGQGHAVDAHRDPLSLRMLLSRR
jgi:VCBS repeat-containing protein